MESKRRRIGSAPGELTQPDYYALLEISPGADFDTIKQAYHKLALRYHPDRNKGNEVECETKFKEVAAAYAVLSDPEKRTQYDASHRFFQSNDLREVFNQFISSGSTASFSDFFGSFSSRSFSSRSFSSFASSSSAQPTASSSPPPSTGLSSSSSSSGVWGQQGSFSFNKKRPPSKGQNLRTTLHVTFNESVFGCTKTIALKTLAWCSACGGLGVGGHCTAVNGSANGGRSAAECTACGGTGTYSQRSSVVTINSTCGACGGKGIVVDETTKCKCCHHGRVHQTKELRIEVPAGVMKNMRKIYEGEGDVGEYGGLPGDLIVVFDVEDSPVFAREGDDATCDISVNFFQAALGARLAVQGLYGQLLRLDVPAGTQPHDVLRLDDEGFVNVATKKRGHLYIRVVLSIPKGLTPRQAELLNQAQQEWNEASAAAEAAATAPSSSDYDEVPAGGDSKIHQSFDLSSTQHVAVDGRDTCSSSSQHEAGLDSSAARYGGGVDPTSGSYGYETTATTIPTVPSAEAPTTVSVAADPMSVRHLTNLHDVSINTSPSLSECSS